MSKELTYLAPEKIEHFCEHSLLVHRETEVQHVKDVQMFALNLYIQKEANCNVMINFMWQLHWATGCPKS